MFGTATKKEQTKAETVQRVTDHPEVRDAIDRYTRVKLELDDVGRRISDAHSGLNRLTDEHGRPADRLTLAAERLLEGSTEVPQGVEAEGIRKTLAGLYERRPLLERAVELGKRKVLEAEDRAGRELWEAFGRDEFAKASRELVLAVAAAGAAVEKWKAAHNAATDAGIRWHQYADVPEAKIQNFALTTGDAAREPELFPCHLGHAGKAVAWGVAVGVIEANEAAKLLGKPLRKS